MPKKYFNVTGLCLPDKHYMVDISNKVNQIATMVERGDYFTINRARQYGKTTIIRQLEKYLLEKGYQVARISFEGIGDEPFENAKNFCQTLLRQISEALNCNDIKGYTTWINKSVSTFEEFDIHLNKVCKNKKVVLFIDETDKTSNNMVFLRFIGMLRDKYLVRGNSKKATFQSVILAGVYDIRNLKLKMIQAGTHQLQDGEKRINSPWNIAAEFKVDMSFSAPEIATMLNEYEKDYKTGMDIETISKEIRAYTNGYPYLVSRICKKIEEDLDRDWTINGIQKAVKMILRDRSTLFDDIAQNIAANKELHDMMFNIVALGEQYTYSAIDATIDLGLTFGFLIRQGDNVVIGNRIFEILFYEYFIHRMKLKKRELREDLASEVVFNNKFNMQLTIEKFTRHYYELYRESEKKFMESECRMLFLTYLRPLINGGGFYHIESETRNAKRMDVIVDYNSEQFIVELKLWYGDTSHENALEQIAGYLESKNENTGYLLTFDFRKEQNTGKPKMEWVEYKGKRIFDIIVGI